MPQNKVVFITGASSGIGYQTALAFARRGYRVAGTARDAARLESLAAEINPMNDTELLCLSVDVRDPEAVRERVEQAFTHFGRLDIVIANAGIGHRGGVIDADWEGIETALQTNINGVLHTIRAAVPYMRQQGEGHVVTISSVAYNMTVPYAAYYAASKAFISSLARSLRLELVDENIHVTDMVIGRTDTNFNRNRVGGTRTGGSIPNMAPEQVAEAILYAVENRQNTVTLRWLDRLMVLANLLFPNFVGRIAKRQYK